MAFCSKCGTAVPDEARFCPACGQPQAVVEAQPAAVAAEPAAVQQGSPQQSYYAPPQEAPAPQQSYYAPPQETPTPQQSYYAPPQEAPPPQQNYYAQQPQPAQQQSYYVPPQPAQQNYYAQQPPQQSYYAPPQGAPQQPQQNYYAQQNGPAPGGYGYQNYQQQPPQRQAGPADIAENKGISVLCYLGILFLIPLLSKPNSTFARYHSNQGLLLCLLAIAISIVSWIFVFVSWTVSAVLSWIGWIFVIVMMILGIVNTVNGQMKPLPLIGNITLIKS